eukprot:7230461-Alexandrium_andersonii.AAC.1
MELARPPAVLSSPRPTSSQPSPMPLRQDRPLQPSALGLALFAIHHRFRVVELKGDVDLVDRVGNRNTVKPTFWNTKNKIQREGVGIKNGAPRNQIFIRIRAQGGSGTGEEPLLKA